MATVQKQFFRGSASTSQSTVYTVPSSTDAIVTNIIVSNTDSVEHTFSILLDGFAIASETPVARNGIVAIDAKQVLAEGDEVAIVASSGNVKVHISGVEIS